MSDKNPHLRAPLASLLVGAACLSLAAPALAQQAQPQRPGETMGLRYLTWSGKPAETRTPEGLRRPVSLTAPHAAPVPTSTARSSRYGSTTWTGPTPASVWTGGPTALPAYARQPAPSQQAAPEPESAPTPAYEPAPQAPTLQQAPRPQMAQDVREQAPTQAEFATSPDYTPARSVAGRPMRSNDPYFEAPPQVRAAMQPEGAPVLNPAAYDPMAPRADAPIFRMAQARQQSVEAAQHSEAETPPAADTQDKSAPRQMAEAAPSRPGDAPRQGPRYYSLHRDAGHEPDPVVLPESVYIGGASMDLAEPPPAPVVQRTVNGRVQAITSNQDPSLP